MTQPYHHGTLRQALLNAAEAILDHEGIDALTLRAAARQAGVSHGAPAHHFHDLTGLLTELAASGFVRLKQAIQDGGPDSDGTANAISMGLNYVSFARAHPGIFKLMFRSERLDWSSEALSMAGSECFRLLTPTAASSGAQSVMGDVEALTVASAKWSLVHGLATLVVDGRLPAFADRVPGARLESLIENVLETGLAGCV